MSNYTKDSSDTFLDNYSDEDLQQELLKRRVTKNEAYSVEGRDGIAFFIIQKKEGSLLPEKVLVLEVGLNKWILHKDDIICLKHLFSLVVKSS